MEARLLTCAYSYHSQRFYTGFKNGLGTYLFRLQTEGDCEVFCRGEAHRIQAGDLLLLKPGDNYELLVDNADNPGGRIASGDYYLFCEGSWIDDWWSRMQRSPITRIDQDETLLGMWRQLILEKRRVPGEKNSELTDYLLRSLCLYLDRALTETTPEGSRTAFTALKLKRFIEEHATGTFKLEEAARHAGLSLSRAVHLFKACYGLTMIQYALEIRLNAALERMKYSSMTLEQIAETCGFASYSYFHRVFRSKYGVAPAQYRTEATSGK